MADLNANIILGNRPAEIENPQNVLMRALQMRQQQGALQHQEMLQQREMRSIEDQNRLRAILQAGGGEEELLRGGFTDQAVKLGEHKRKGQETDASTNLKNLEATAKRFGIVRDVANGINSPETWAQGAAILQQNGIPPTALGQAYDPVAIEALRAQAVTKNDEIQHALRQAQFQQTGQRDAQNAQHQNAQVQATLRGQNMTDSRARQGLALREQEIAMGGKPPPGYVWDGPGKLAAIPGGPGSKPTDSQATAGGYASRMVQADKLLQPIETKINNMGLKAKQRVEGMAVVGDIANAALSADQQSVDQAQRDFINAVLRRESGAVISDQEFANARKQYFVQPGDSKQVIEQKRANRAQSIKGVSGAAGPAAPKPATGGFKILSVEQ
jgi:hypothetical protein